MSWLWKADSSSTASFEKALSKLSNQIAAASVSLDGTRTRSRRLKGFWTLWTTLAYLLYTLVITLVLGPQKWSLPHYAGLIGAPITIYLVRRGVTMFYDWRLARQQTYLTFLQKQREEKISDLKKATKYDSTQELLQKYGGAPKPTPSKQPQQGTKRKINPQPQPGRTGMPPPPTANISGRAPQPPATPQRPPPNSSPKSPNSQPSPLFSTGALAASPTTTVSPNEPGFAPNAFSESYTTSLPAYDQPLHWYDRILDVLLGEDETLAKNRLILLCTNCRLVNGQAPPGVKTLEEIGRWRCSNCSAWNGVDAASTKEVKEIMEKKDDEEGWEKTSREAAKDDEVVGRLIKSEEITAKEKPDEIVGVESTDNDGDQSSSSAEKVVRKRTTRSSKHQED